MPLNTGLLYGKMKYGYLRPHSYKLVHILKNRIHYDDISYALRRLISAANRLFVRKRIYDDNNETTKVLHYLPLMS